MFRWLRGRKTMVEQAHLGEDSTFFSKHGRPQIATTESHWPSFDAEYAYYEFEVEVFTPDRARSMSRLAGTPLLGGWPWEGR